MDGTTTPQPAESSAAPSEGAKADEQGQAKKARGRRQMTPEQRERATKRQAVSRELEALMSSDDPGALSRAVDALKAARKGDVPQAEAKAPAAGGAAGAPAAPPPPLPGWPTHDAILRARPPAQTVVNSLAMVVALVTEVDLSRPRHLPGLSEPVVFTDMLVKDSAPVIALYAPDVLNTPWGALGCTMITVATIVAAEVMLRRGEAEAQKAQGKVEGAGAPVTAGGTQ